MPVPGTYLRVSSIRMGTQKQPVPCIFRFIDLCSTCSSIFEFLISDHVNCEILKWQTEEQYITFEMCFKSFYFGLRSYGMWCLLLGDRFQNFGDYCIVCHIDRHENLSYKIENPSSLSGRYSFKSNPRITRHFLSNNFLHLKAFYMETFRSCLLKFPSLKNGIRNVLFQNAACVSESYIQY